ncbi:MAG: TonB family protein [Sulfurovaceae bacterium]|nr:TonB family protein [Sulfurovaceae bacterium]
MSKAPKAFSERVIKIAMVVPQEESIQQQAVNEPVKEKVEEQKEDKPVQKVEKTKPIQTNSKAIIKQPDISKQAEQHDVKKQQVAQKTYVSSQVEKNEFISEIKSEIRRNKYYPEAARRRGQEGTVAISFHVNTDGSASNVICNGEHSVLNGAAKDAVNKAFPVKITQNIASALPMDLSLVLDFKLD